MASTFTFERMYQILIGFKNGTSFNTVVILEPEHHIEISIKEDIPNEGSSLNPCEINLYNIGKENVQYLSQKGLSIIVKAGYKYEGGLTLTPSLMQVVYEGDVVEAYHSNTGVDVVSTVVCQEGHHQAIQAKLLQPLALAAGTTAENAFKQLLSYIPYSVEVNFKDMQTITLQKTLTIQGQVVKELDTLCKKLSEPKKGRVITWMFHRGKIIVLDRRPQTLNSRFVVHRIPRSRIKDTVDIGFDEKTATPQTVNVGISEVKIRCYLLPAVTIGDSIIIEPKENSYYHTELVTGDQEFAVTGVTTELSYDGDKWDTIIKGRIKE